MKDKILYQRRTDGDYKGYTEDSFYFNSTEQLWCWKQTSTEKIFKAKTINELKQIKENNFIGKGNYEHKNDSSLNPEHTSTEEFGKKTGLGGKEYISMLLKRAVLPINESDKRGAGRKKKGMHFIKCLEESDIHFEQIIHKRKVWVFKNVTNNKIKIFKSLWEKK
mgnify:CR=1 FL=1